MPRNYTETNQGSVSLVVTGSAGFVGKSLMRRLSDSQRGVTSLYHSKLPEPMALIKPVFADLVKIEPLGSTVGRGDTVVHLAWQQSFRSPWEEGFWAQEGVRQDSKNISMVKNLVKVMEQRRAKRIVFVSAIGASRQSDAWYLQEKYFAEAIILNSKIPEKVIIRSSLAYGEISTKDRLVSSIERLMRFPWFYPVPKFKEKLAPIHVDDLSDVIMRLIDHTMKESAEIIEVIGGESLGIDEIFRFVSLGIGKGSHFAVKGILGQALTPLVEQINRHRHESIPHLRDLLTVGNRKDLAIEINNPISNDLPIMTRKFQETMVSETH